MALGWFVVIIADVVPNAHSIGLALTAVAPKEIPSADWHEFFLAIVTVSTTMFAGTVAVGAFAQRPRDSGEPATIGVRAMTVVVVGTVVQLLLTPLVLFSTSTMLSALMLVPHFPVRYVTVACIAVVLLETMFLIVLINERETTQRILAALNDWGGQTDRLRRVRTELVDAVQPYLPASEAQGRPWPSTLLDLTKSLESYGAPDELRARIAAHNADRATCLSEAVAAKARHETDEPFMREAERLTPDRMQRVLLSLALTGPVTLAAAPTPPLFALVTAGMTFLGMVYIALALLGLMRANVARLLNQPKR